MKTIRLPAAFTLIELLVVIAIIAMLAGIAMPVYNMVMLQGRQVAALASGKQIMIGLRAYANDHGDAFPAEKNAYDEPIVTSNDALRSLIPTYIDNERVFTVASSKTGAAADNKMAEPAQMLARGENHWAYIEGLSQTSNSNWPLLVDHTDGAGYYNDREGQLGGTWKGKKTVMLNTDGSGAIVPMLGSGEKRYVPRFDDRTKNALQVGEYMGDAVKLLEPAN